MNFQDLPIDFSMRPKDEKPERNTESQNGADTKRDELLKQEKRVRRAFEYVNLELNKRKRNK